jgi:AraC-like DNA-binding protein
METTFFDFLIFGNGMILLFLGFIQLSYKRKVLNNYLAVLLFSLSGYMLLYNWGFKTKFIYSYPFLLNADLIVSYVLAPCIFLYFRSISNVPMKTIPHYLPLFIPALLIFIFSIVYNLVNPQLAANYFATQPTSPPYLQASLLGYLNTLGDAAVALAFISAFWTNRFLFKQKNLLASNEFRIVLIFILCMLCTSLVVVYSQIIKSNSLMLVALNGYGVILIGYSFFTYRYPEFMQIVLREVKTLKYEQSHLQGSNVPKIIRQLDDLMTKEKLYLDEKLTLNKLSKQLTITTHQLSELLNQHHKMNFRGFINGFRIKEAQQLLITKPNMSILEVAYASGFNSKAVFNAAFSEQVQCTPTDYRKKHLRTGSKPTRT